MISSISLVIFTFFQLQNSSNQASCLGLHVFQRLRTAHTHNHIFSVVVHQCNMSFLPGNLWDWFIKWWDVVNTTFNPKNYPALCKSWSMQNNAFELFYFSSPESSPLVSLVRGNQWSLWALVWQLTLPPGTFLKEPGHL